MNCLRKGATLVLAGEVFYAVWFSAALAFGFYVTHFFLPGYFLLDWIAALIEIIFYAFCRKQRQTIEHKVS